MSADTALPYGAQHFIGGRFTAANGKRSGPVFNPSTGAEIYRAAYADRATLADAVATAKRAGREWAAVSQARRLQALFGLHKILEAKTDRLAHIIGLENGKTLADAKGEIGRALEAVEFATNFPHLSKGEYSVNVGGGIDAYSFRVPIGVAACIAPFNFPVMAPLMMATMAIAVGNAVIVKPSERVPGASALLSEFWSEAGLPAGVWNTVNGDGETATAILEHPDISAVVFVGSTKVGEAVYQHGTKHNKRVAAYTAGKNHMVVLPDADFDAAANAFVSAGYGSSSQRCMAVSILVCVGDRTANQMRERIAARIKSLKVGSYDDPTADFGPVVTQAAKQTVEQAIDQALAEGGELVCDGRGLAIPGHENGFFTGPTLIDRVTDAMQLWREEIFGPVRGMMRVKNLDEAIDLVNAHQYGNGAAIFTRSGAAGRRFCAEVEAGMLGVNVPIPVPAGYHNFGGLRRSKFGEAHLFGPDAVRFFSKLKTVSQRWPESDAASLEAGMSLSFPSNS